MAAESRIVPSATETELISIPFDEKKWNERQRLGLFHFVAVAAQWERWRLFDRVQLRQAVLLSLNVDPLPYGLVPGGDLFEMVCGALEDVSAPNRHRVYQRLRLAESHLDAQLERAGDIDGEPAVRLRDFARWARAVARWELPGAFLDLEAVTDSTVEGETALEKAARLAKAHFTKLRAKGKGWPTVDEGTQWLKRQGLLTSTADCKAVMKVIRPHDLPRGPRTGRDDDE